MYIVIKAVLETVQFRYIHTVQRCRGANNVRVWNFPSFRFVINSASDCADAISVVSQTVLMPNQSADSETVAELLHVTQHQLCLRCH
jgi:hypothetical protein